MTLIQEVQGLETFLGMKRSSISHRDDGRRNDDGCDECFGIHT